MGGTRVFWEIDAEVALSFFSWQTDDVSIKTDPI